jgi:hypothetical protein
MTGSNPSVPTVKWAATPTAPPNNKSPQFAKYATRSAKDAITIEKKH